MQTLSVGKSLKFVLWEKVKSLPKDKILDQTKLKAFADDKLNNTKMAISVFDSRKHCGKRRYCLYKQFLLFPVFSKGLFPRRIKGFIVWEWVKYLPNDTFLK